MVHGNPKPINPNPNTLKAEVLPFPLVHVRGCSTPNPSCAQGVVGGIHVPAHPSCARRGLGYPYPRPPCVRAWLVEMLGCSGGIRRVPGCPCARELGCSGAWVLGCSGCSGAWLCSRVLGSSGAGVLGCSVAPRCSGARLLGCSVAWMLGCSGARLLGLILGCLVHGRSGARLLGCSGAWALGCLVALLLGCSGARLLRSSWVLGCLGARVLGCLGMNTRLLGCSVARVLDAQVLGISGARLLACWGGPGKTL